MTTRENVERIVDAIRKTTPKDWLAARILIEGAIDVAVVEERQRIVAILESFEADVPLSSILEQVRGAQ